MPVAKEEKSKASLRLLDRSIDFGFIFSTIVEMRENGAFR